MSSYRRGLMVVSGRILQAHAANEGPILTLVLG